MSSLTRREHSHKMLWNSSNAQLAAEFSEMGFLKSNERNFEEKELMFQQKRKKVLSSEMGEMVLFLLIEKEAL